jgi:hypothetical protein
MTIMLITGASNTIFLKLQIEIRDNGGNKYKHPYFHSINVFGATSFAIIFYAFYKMYMDKKYGSILNSPDVKLAVANGKKEYLHWGWMAIPAFLDF